MKKLVKLIAGVLFLWFARTIAVDDLARIRKRPNMLVLRVTAAIATIFFALLTISFVTSALSLNALEKLSSRRFLIFLAPLARSIYLMRYPTFDWENKLIINDSKAAFIFWGIIFLALDFCCFFKKSPDRGSESGVQFTKIRIFDTI